MPEKKPPAIKRPIITLTTDFGSGDYRVAAMKGVLCELNPHALIIDISHDVPAYDLMSASFLMRAVFFDFPLNTIHVVVVEPGQGPKKRPILVRSENYYFFAPDNGVLSLVYDVERVSRCFEINATHYFQQPVNPLLHARDIYASCAGYLSKSFSGDDFGEEITDYARINTPKPAAAGKQCKGVVLHVDSFGNLITNITVSDLTRFMKSVGAKRFRVAVGGKVVGPHAVNYGQGQGEAFSVSGAHGFLGIAAAQKPAAKVLGASRGQEVVVQLE